MSAGRIVVCGAVAQKPRQPGHSWPFLLYLLGLRRLGYEVLFVDRLATAEPNGVEHVRSTLGRFGIAWTIAHDDGTHSGLSRPDTITWVRSADLLLNVMGEALDVRFPDDFFDGVHTVGQLTAAVRVSLSPL